MALLLAGIDEAGYGPLLGPLTVAMAMFRIDPWTPGDRAPDLWTLLEPAVGRAGSSPRARILIDDSKKLKLPNTSTGRASTRHPLLHLERGVLAFLGASNALPRTDDDLFRALGVDLGEAPWALSSSTPVPVAWSEAQIAIASNLLAGTLGTAGVGVVGLSCVSVNVDRFNETVRSTGTKGETTLLAIGRHLRALLSVPDAAPPHHVRVVCDRLGGRTAYASLLERETSLEATVLEETNRVSRYALRRVGETGEARVVVHFMPEAERAHLGVALASMTAKYVRELAMARFNRYWGTKMPDLKPTAGYRQDAARWLREASGILTDDDRSELIRLA